MIGNCDPKTCPLDKHTCTYPEPPCSLKRCSFDLKDDGKPYVCRCERIFPIGYQDGTLKK